jgi:pimeloyl-ACP methyl ester carboxylesterase
MNAVVLSNLANVASGFHVTAVHLPFTSLADDVATVKRTLALEDGPVLLVGHSYGGAVITEAGNDPRAGAGEDRRGADACPDDPHSFQPRPDAFTSD